MFVDDLSFPSANGRDTISGWLYCPGQGRPRAIVQLIHGFAEHAGRYKHMIARLVSEGYVVAADDHVGHGVTAESSGHWQDTGGTGYQTYIDDELTLTERARQAFPGLPVFIFGHSWGTMIGREYVAQHPDQVSGLILSGVVEQLTAAGLDLEVLGQSARAAVAANVSSPLLPSASEVVDELAEVIVAKLNVRFDDDDDPMAWVAADPQVRAKFLHDPLGGTSRMPSFEFFRDLLRLYIRVGSDWFVKRMPTDVPVLIMSGAGDPMGNYGEGAYRLANQLWKEGNRDVRVRVFPDVRHEIHNEPGSRGEVYAETVTFLNRLS